jgi:hypothetical protein
MLANLGSFKLGPMVLPRDYETEAESGANFDQSNRRGTGT